MRIDAPSIPLPLWPRAERTRDPLNHASLPDAGPLQLEYRRPAFRFDVLKLVTWFAVLALSVILLVRFLNAAGYWRYSLPVLALLDVGFVFYWLRRHRRPDQWWLILAGPVGWSLLALPIGPELSYLILYPVALASTVLLADGILTHNGAFLCANPRLDPDVRSEWSVLWLQQRRRLIGGYVLAALDVRSPPVLEPPRGQQPLVTRFRTQQGGIIERYAAVLAAAGIGYLLGVIPLLLVHPRALGASVAVVVATVSILVAAVQASKPQWHLRRLPSLYRFWADGIQHWYTHGADDNGAPGLWRSPCGPCHRRRALSCLAIFTFCLMTLQSAGLFPFAVAFASLGIAPESLRGLNMEKLIEDAAEARSRPFDELRADMTGQQRAAIDRLPPALRDRYYEHLQKQDALSRVAKTPAPRTDAKRSDWWEGVLWPGPNGAVFSWTGFLVGLPTALGFPVFLFVLSNLALCAPGLARQHVALDEGSDYEKFETDWDGYVQRLRTSPNEEERKHLFIGVTVEQNTPVLLHRDILAEHAHITGDSGAGKTSRGVAPLLAQLADFPNTSIVVIDLKGDRALFEAAKVGAARIANRRFRWFTNDAGLSTFAFNPFLQTHFRNLTPHQRAEILLQSLGLDHGEEYGPSYFSRVNRDVLARLFADFPKAASFRALRDHVPHLGLKGKQLEDAGELLSVIRSIASFDALNLTATDPGVHPAAIEAAIDLGRVTTTPEVVYFWLPSAIETASVREIAKLALYSLLTAAQRRASGTSEGPKVFLLIDEFQQIVSENLQIILRQARSMGIGTILANQTLSDLRKGRTDLIPVVQANTRFKQAFASTDVMQQDMLIKASGEAVYGMRNVRFGEKGHEEGWGWTEHIDARITRNEIIRATDSAGCNYLQVSRGLGYTQFSGFPFIAHTSFHITQRLFEERSHTPWPPVTDETIVAMDNADEVKTKPIPDPVLPSPVPQAKASRTESDVKDLIDWFDKTIDADTGNTPP